MNAMVNNLVLFELSALLLGACILLLKTAFDRSGKGIFSRANGAGRRRVFGLNANREIRDDGPETGSAS